MSIESSIELAIADHRAHCQEVRCQCDYEFIEDLSRAKNELDQLRALAKQQHEALVSLCDKNLSYLNNYVRGGLICAQDVNQGREAIAKYEAMQK